MGEVYLSGLTWVIAATYNIRTPVAKFFKTLDDVPFPIALAFTLSVTFLSAVYTKSAYSIHANGAIHVAR